jgi:DNA-directed RNA polymerase subunit RPC12/RpoP
MQIPTEITCVECGGVASLISFVPDDGVIEPGTALAYRCADCLERFDVVIEEEDLEEAEPSF